MNNFSKEQMYNTINTIANEELNLETARKMIANLVVENTNMRRKIDKATEYIKKQYYKKIFDGEYVVNADDLLSILESEGENAGMSIKDINKILKLDILKGSDKK